jgi:hypothetical protein
MQDNPIYLGDALRRKRWRELWETVAVPDDWSACWNWKGPIWRNGYGVKCRQYVHRIVAEMCSGRPLPKRVVVHHRCHNKLCVNPSHLQSMTARLEHFKEHAAEMRKALPRGEKHQNFKKLWGAHTTHRTPEQWCASARKNWVTRRANGTATGEKASAAAHKAWATKRARKGTRSATFMVNDIYLGDGCYGYFDGNGIELKLNHHASPCLIYLEPEVIEALQSFWARMQAKREAGK